MLVDEVAIFPFFALALVIEPADRFPDLLVVLRLRILVPLVRVRPPGEAALDVVPMLCGPFVLVLIPGLVAVDLVVIFICTV